MFIKLSFFCSYMAFLFNFFVIFLYEVVKYTDGIAFDEYAGDEIVYKLV